jgi:cobalt-zinc-cadmium resistance protein CzcA
MGWSQPDSLSMEEAIRAALNNNKRIQAATQQVHYQQQLKKTSSELPKTEVSFIYGQFNSIVKDNNVTIQQGIPFPTVLTLRNSYNKALVDASLAQKSSTENELIFQVRSLCFQAYNLYSKKKILEQQDSIFRVLQEAVTRSFKAGEENKLELAKATAKRLEVQNAFRQVNADIEIVATGIQALLNSPQPVSIRNERNKILDMPLVESVDAEANPTIQALQHQADAAEKLKRMERARALPEFRIGYFTQTLVGFQRIDGQDQYFGKEKRFNGIQGGISIPLWFFPNASQIKAQDFAARRAQSELEQTKIDWWALIQKTHQQAVKDKISLDYYNTSGLPLAALIQKQSLTAYQQGEIGLSDLLLNMNQASTIHESYLRTLLDYNLSVIHIDFLIGQKI